MSFLSVQIDERAATSIDRVVSMLPLLKKEGTSNRVRQRSSSTSRKRYSGASDSEVTAALAYLRPLRDNLQALVHLLDPHVADLEERKRSLHSSPSDKLLPIEVLGRVFEAAYSPDWSGIELATSVSHVSRNFRNIALSTPVLWSSVSNSQTEQEISVFLSRSAKAGLTIFINEDPYRQYTMDSRPKLGSFFELVIPHFTRVEEFRFTRDTETWDQYDDSAMWKIVRVPAPRLARMRLDGGDYHEFDDGDGYRDLWMISQWKAPALKTLVMINTNPALNGFGSVEKLSITLSTPEEGFWGVDQLVSSGLYHLARLRELDLTFQNVECRSEDYVNTTLPALERLALTFIGQNSSDAFLAFFDALEYPAITELAVTFRGKRNSVESESESIDLLDVIPVESSCPLLRSILISMDGLKRPLSILGSLFEDLPQIRHVSLEAPVLTTLRFEEEDSWPEKLETLTFVRCSALTLKSIDAVVGLMEDSADWSNFQKLELRGCGRLAASVRQKHGALLKDKLVISA